MLDTEASKMSEYLTTSISEFGMTVVDHATSGRKGAQPDKIASMTSHT